MSIETQILNDWGKEFPVLARYKKGRKLLSVFDPVVFGIELEKFSSEAYRPKLVALNLLSSFPEFAISRSLSTERRPQLSVTYSGHTENYLKVAEIMRNTFPALSGEKDLCDKILIAEYRSEIKKNLEESSSPLAVWFSLIQILKFFGHSAQEKAERERLDAYVKSLPPSSLAIFGNFREFSKRELDAPIAELKDRKKKNISKGRWDCLPGWRVHKLAGRP